MKKRIASFQKKFDDGHEFVDDDGGGGGVVATDDEDEIIQECKALNSRLINL